MQREQFHELLKRAADVCARRELVIFGSQSIHALTDSPPAEVLLSIECDLWFQDEPEVASRLSVELGKDSAFAKMTGVYADLLPPDLPMLPKGWEERLVTHRVGDVTARCLEIHDLPHPAFQFVALDGLAQALDSRLSEESHQPRRLAPGLRPAHLFHRRSTVRSPSNPRPGFPAHPGAQPCGTTRTLLG